jgi:hypothetical protein
MCALPCLGDVQCNSAGGAGMLTGLLSSVHLDGCETSSTRSTGMELHQIETGSMAPAKGQLHGFGAAIHMSNSERSGRGVGALTVAQPSPCWRLRVKSVMCPCGNGQLSLCRPAPSQLASSSALWRWRTTPASLSRRCVITVWATCWRTTTAVALQSALAHTRDLHCAVHCMCSYPGRQL